MDLQLDDPDPRIRDLAYLLFLEELLGGEWVERWARERGKLDALREHLSYNAAASSSAPTRITAAVNPTPHDRATTLSSNAMKTVPPDTAVSAVPMIPARKTVSAMMPAIVNGSPGTCA